MHIIFLRNIIMLFPKNVIVLYFYTGLIELEIKFFESCINKSFVRRYVAVSGISKEGKAKSSKTEDVSFSANVRLS